MREASARVGEVVDRVVSVVVTPPNWCLDRVVVASCVDLLPVSVRSSTGSCGRHTPNLVSRGQCGRMSSRLVVKNPLDILKQNKERAPNGFALVLATFRSTNTSRL